MSDFNLGTVTAYGYAKDKGYTGTEDEYAELMASYADVAEQAAESATQAAASATTASTKASEAAQSATTAASSKTAAQTAQTGAETAAQTATTKAGEASASATTASGKATEATTAAGTATTKASEATTAATTATTKAGEASTSATNAAASATRAQEILDSIPEDYSQMSEDVADLKDGLTAVQTQLEQTTTDALAAYATDTASGSIASFPDGADGVPVKSLTVNIEPVQSGSGDPSPDNVRPISGHTSAVVTGAGVNLFDGVIEEGTIDSSGKNASQANRYRSKNYISVKPSQRYVFSKNGSKQNVNWRLYDINKTFMSVVNIYLNPFTVPDGCYYLRFFADDVINVTSGLQLEHSETPTAYESPNVDTYTIDLNGTRYGGTLDVTTGVMTVTHKLVTYDGSESWSAISTGYYTLAKENDLDKTEQYSDTMICNYLPYEYTQPSVSPSFNAITHTIRVSMPSITSIADFKAYLASNPLQFILKLAEPLTVQLTAEDITTLKGQNSIWNDCGDTEVEYRADTKLYIQKVINS